MTPEERADLILGACPSGFVCRTHGTSDGLHDVIVGHIRLAVRAEREACASEIDSYAATYKDALLESVTRGAANLLRSRM